VQTAGREMGGTADTGRHECPGKSSREESTVKHCTVSWSVRLIGALLALSVVTIHVADQGGITAFTDPDWLGWCYRIIEVAGVLVAAAALIGGESLLTWSGAALLAAGPFIGYLLTRTIGLPDDADDKGNWADSIGTVSLLLEAALVILAVGIVVAKLRSVAPSRPMPYPRRRRFLLIAALRVDQRPYGMRTVR
jgi:hypothetical protein